MGRNRRQRLCQSCLPVFLDLAASERWLGPCLVRSSSDIPRAGWRVRVVIRIVQTFSEPALLFSSALLSLLIISGPIPTPLVSDAPKTPGKPLGRRGDPTKAQEWGSFGSLTAMSTGLTPHGRLPSAPSRLWKILGSAGLEHGEYDVALTCTGIAASLCLQLLVCTTGVTAVPSLQSCC